MNDKAWKNAFIYFSVPKGQRCPRWEGRALHDDTPCDETDTIDWSFVKRARGGRGGPPEPSQVLCDMLLRDGVGGVKGVSGGSWYLFNYGFPWWLRCSRIYLQCRRPRHDSWAGKISWRREGLLTLVFFPGKFHEQKSLAGCSPWDHKESDMIEWISDGWFALLYSRNQHNLVKQFFLN